MSKFTSSVTLLNAVTTTTTSNGENVSARSNIAFMLFATGVSSGNAIFYVDASNDNINWISGIAVQDAQSISATTNAALFVKSKTLSATTTSGLLIIDNAWQYVRVRAAVATDGAYTALLQAAE